MSSGAITQKRRDDLAGLAEPTSSNPLAASGAAHHAALGQPGKFFFSSV